MTPIGAYHPGLAAVALAVGVVAAVLVRALDRRWGATSALAVAAWSSGAVVLVGRLTRVSVGVGLLAVAAAAAARGTWAGGRHPETRAWTLAGVASVGGVWAAVPDTETPLVVGVITVVVVVVGGGVGRGGSALDRSQRWAWAAAAALAAVGGGWGTRQLIGGLVAAGLLAMLPSVGPAAPFRLAPVVVAHVGAVAVASRVLTRWDPGPAATAGVALLVGSAIVSRIVLGSRALRTAGPARPARARRGRRRGGRRPRRR